jgi:hypothetical protein
MKKLKVISGEKMNSIETISLDELRGQFHQVYHALAGRGFTREDVIFFTQELSYRNGKSVIEPTHCLTPKNKLFRIENVCGYYILESIKDAASVRKFKEVAKYTRRERRTARLKMERLMKKARLQGTDTLPIELGNKKYNTAA